MESFPSVNIIPKSAYWSVMNVPRGNPVKSIVVKSPTAAIHSSLSTKSIKPEEAGIENETQPIRAIAEKIFDVLLILWILHRAVSGGVCAETDNLAQGL